MYKDRGNDEDSVCMPLDKWIFQDKESNIKGSQEEGMRLYNKDIIVIRFHESRYREDS